jgi:hypothetical protein
MRAAAVSIYLYRERDTHTRTVTHTNTHTHAQRYVYNILWTRMQHFVIIKHVECDVLC